MESIEAVKKYYEYLKNVAGFSITVHYPPGNSNKALFIKALPIPTVHFNPYCTHLKQNLELHPKCLECQMKSAQKCIKEGAFSGVCHAGIFEFVYPLKFGDETVGILSVGEYASENFAMYATRISQNNNVEKNFLLAFRSTLKSEIPDKEYVDTLIIPLLTMIKNVSISHQRTGVHVKSVFPFHGIISFCNRFYTHKITIELLSEKFFCSKSYIARTFKKETGKSLPEYINDLRIKNAMQLLKSTNASVAQIGVTVGYDDPSYFTKCFIKITGTTPKKWRNLNKPQD